MNIIPSSVNPLTLAEPGASSRTLSSQSDETQLDQQSFLKLMTAQLNNQDPFKPLDNTQMVAQMAQFSQVAGQAEMNISLREILQQLGSPSFTDRASWIGQEVLVNNDIAAPNDNGEYSGQITLSEPTDNLVVELHDTNGDLVERLELGAQSTPNIPFSWQGDKNGPPLRISVNGTSHAQIASWAPVRGLSNPTSQDTQQLITDIGSIDPNVVIQLGRAS